jgi:hypothetical protein
MIERALEVNPTASVFVLANHGLVVCGETCDAAEHLLGEVDRRLAAPVRANHNLSLDAVSQRILEGGILYPCQAIFLGTAVGSMAGCRFLLEAAKELTASQSSVLRGLLEVVRRIDADAPIRYLSNPEVLALLNEDAHGYLLCTEKNAVPEQSSGQALL